MKRAFIIVAGSLFVSAAVDKTLTPGPKNAELKASA